MVTYSLWRLLHKLYLFLYVFATNHSRYKLLLQVFKTHYVFIASSGLKLKDSEVLWASEGYCLKIKVFSSHPFPVVFKEINYSVDTFFCKVSFKGLKSSYWKVISVLFVYRRVVKLVCDIFNLLSVETLLIKIRIFIFWHWPGYVLIVPDHWSSIKPVWY